MNNAQNGRSECMQTPQNGLRIGLVEHMRTALHTQSGLRMDVALEMRPKKFHIVHHRETQREHTMPRSYAEGREESSPTYRDGVCNFTAGEKLRKDHFPFADQQVTAQKSACVHHFK
jgi:hypothetical protein